MDRFGESNRMNSQSITLRYLVLATANILAGLLGLLFVSLISGNFGPGGLGDVALATALLTYATVATTGGTDIYAIKMTAASPLVLGRMISSVMLVRLAVGTLCYVALLIIALQIYPERTVLIAIFGMALFPAALSISWVPQALHKSGVFALANLLTQAASLALLWVAIQLGYGLPAAAVAKVLADALAALGLLHWLRRIGQRIESPPRLGSLVRLALDCVPITGTQLVRMAGLGSDLIILAFFVGRDEIGLFAAAFKIFGFLLGLATAYFVILLPRIAQHPDKAALSAEMGSSLRRAMPPAVLVVIAIGLSAEQLMVLLFGGAFAESVPVLQLLSLAWLANVWHRHYRQILLTRGLHGSDFRHSAASCVVHLTARVALIPFLGIVGAALGMLLGEAYLLVVQGRTALRELR